METRQRRASLQCGFKIQVKKMDPTFSKTRLMKELKEFRSHIKSKLRFSGLITGEPIVCNEQYSQIELDYPSAFPARRSHYRKRSGGMIKKGVVDMTLKKGCQQFWYFIS